MLHRPASVPGELFEPRAVGSLYSLGPGGATVGRHSRAESQRHWKRAVYFGGSLPLPEGIKLEAKEFLALDVSQEGQALMLGYQAGTAVSGDLPLYVPGIYEEALAAGKLPSEFAKG